MIHVKLDIAFPAHALLRQTPGWHGRWGRHLFHVNEDVSECDHWVVYDLPNRLSPCLCDPAKVILVTGEPQSVFRYDRSYVRQFARVVTSHADLTHPGKLLTQQGLPWHVGRRQRMHRNLGWSKSYDELQAMGIPKKDRTVSLVCSTASGTPGHRARNAFVEALASRFAGRIDVFGRGRREIEDKWDALAPYRYTIVLENSSHSHYWSEKLADAFLAGCYPLYYGCPNLDQYFSPSAFHAIDLRDINAAVSAVEAVMDSDPYEQALPAIAESRNQILDRYNLFAMVAELCPARANPVKMPVRLRTHSQCQSLWTKVSKRATARLRSFRKPG